MREDLGFWTPRRIEALKRMRADKMSFSEIGAELGITKDAAWGKFYRVTKEQVNAV
jgi:hypothetical protein